MKELTEALSSAGLQGTATTLIEAKRPLLGVTLKTRDPFALWQSFREKFEQTGYWPLLLDDSEPCRRLLGEGIDGWEGEGPPEVESLLDLLDGPGALEYLRGELEGEPAEDGEWPAVSFPGTKFQNLPQGFVGKLMGSKVSLALLPVKNPWEVFAHLNFGGWNECPGPSVHVALHRSWNQKWGAEPVTLSNDTIECRVTQPPQTKEEAMELAREQYLYCPDIVEQGVQTLCSLGSVLKDGTVWFFWWD